MERQRMHRHSHHHPDLARHKDCGLYALLGTLLHLNGHPLHLLTPLNVHRTRTYLAGLLQQRQCHFDINNILFPSKHPQLTPVPDATTIQPPPQHLPISAHLSTRRHTFLHTHDKFFWSG